jgi:hypothetical protein
MSFEFRAHIRPIIRFVNPISATSAIDLLTLYKSPSVNQVSGFCHHIDQLDPNDLVAAYHQVREAAPRRHPRGKRYFVGHSGVTSNGGHSNRREEHLAVALWNNCNDGSPLVMPDGRVLDLLDYQFPLKARQGDKGVGKVDLFGLINGETPCVIELKIHADGMSKNDTPLRAFLEALAYCAMVEANIVDIAQEVAENWDKKLVGGRPDLIVMAPSEYWSAYLSHPAVGKWWPSLCRLADQLEKSLGLKTHFIALRDVDFSMGLAGQKPQLVRECSLINLADMAQ